MRSDSFHFVIWHHSEFLAKNDTAESKNQHLYIKPERTVTQIVKVQFQAAEHFLHCVCISVVERGIARYTRAYLVEEGISGVMLHYLVYEMLALWAVAHECHVANQDVPQLRQFIKMMAAQELSYFSQSRVLIATGMTQLRSHLLCIKTHATILIYAERPAKTSYAFLFIYCRSSVIKFYQDIAEEEQR